MIRLLPPPILGLLKPGCPSRQRSNGRHVYDAFRFNTVLQRMYCFAIPTEIGPTDSASITVKTARGQRKLKRK
jgi:hypothetical protein